MTRYKETGINNLFGEEFRLEKISKHGDPLERLNEVIDWEFFSPVLQEPEDKERKSNTGAKPHSLILCSRY